MADQVHHVKSNLIYQYHWLSFRFPDVLKFHVACRSLSFRIPAGMRPGLEENI